MESFESIKHWINPRFLERFKNEFESMILPSALDVVVTTYLRSEAKEIQLSDPMKEVLLTHL